MAKRGRKIIPADEAPPAASPAYGKALLAAVVVAAGIGGALLFRNPGPQLAPESDDAPLVLREETAGPLYLAEGSAGEERPWHAATGGATSTSPSAAPLVSISPFEERGEDPPALASRYPREPAEDAVLSPLPLGRDDELADGGEAQRVERVHRIADGDDLASLAERYLGDAGRAGEIYDANRHVLVDPEVLPIGIELAIPAR